MRRFSFAFAITVLMPFMAAKAAPEPSHFSLALMRRISSDGPRIVATHLTLRHDWTRVEHDVASNDPALSAQDLRALLDYAPRNEVAALQVALRARLQIDAAAGLAALSPVSHNAFSGRYVCGAGDARWKHQLRPALLATHDITYALQRGDCLRALKLHKRS